MMFGRPAKYVITKDNKIIVFGTVFQHSEFKHMSPVRAGFISFGVDEEGNPDCTCYGDSISLGIGSDPEKDTRLAKSQLNL
jgi:hypothetical protein